MTERSHFRNSFITFCSVLIFGACGVDNGGGYGPSAEQVRNYSTWVITDAIWSLHNRYVAGESCGSDVNKVDVTCLSGGTVTISGWLDCGSDRPEERDLTYSFNNCAEAEEGGIVTFVDGSCRQQGQWVKDEYQQMTFAGTSTMNMTLFIDGKNHAVEHPACEFSINEELDVGEWSFAGLLCGEPFSW
jgi:hypothetical protein